MIQAFGRFTYAGLTSSLQRQILSSIVLVLILVVSHPSRAWSEDQPNLLSPSEAYKSALAPFTATRSQPDDLTDADRIALTIGIARAAQDCLALSGETTKLEGNEKELFALTQLCIFGQQYEPARAVAVKYLALPEPTQREQALLLLVHAFLGLHAPDSAEPQIISLLRDYPYDASIHQAIDQVIDEAELSNIASPFNNIALRLCKTQAEATLPILTKGKALEGKDSSVSAATLFTDAVRCATIARTSKQPDNLDQLASIVQQSSWAGTADLTVMQQALRREQMVGEKTPINTLHGHALGTASLVPRVISLSHGKWLFVPFTLWSPSTPQILRNLAQASPQQTIYAITSWRTNTGKEDEASNQLLEELRLWKQNLPPRVFLLIVPDTEISAFAADTFPAGILLQDGKVLMNGPISGKGEQRRLLGLCKGQAGTQLP